MSKDRLSSPFPIILTIGAVWGLAETALGMGLKACASAVSGSVMTAVALFFLSMTWKLSRRMASFLWLLLIVSGIKMFDALLLGLPLRHGAVANPIFAFWTEALGFLILLAVVKPTLIASKPGQALLGSLSALVAVNLFPLVKYVTGIPACVVPGTSYPLSLYYAPVAIGLSFFTVPLGFWLAERMLASQTQPKVVFGAKAFRRLASPGVLAICLLIIVLIRLGK